MITEFIRILFFAALPTFAISFAMVFFAIKRGYLASDESVEELKKRKKKAKKDKTEFKVNPVHSKWLYFGGGYYGLMALTTYAHVEILEVHNFFADYSSFSALIEQISVGAIIRLIIDSFMNLIPAFTWFLYWPKIIAMQAGWFWLGASYAGYYLGELLGRQYAIEHSNKQEKNI